MWYNACLAGSTFLFSHSQCHVAFAGDQAWDEERRRKKIRKLALMKTRSPGILAMNLETERRIEVNSNQLSAMPDDKALKCFSPFFSFFLDFFSYRERDWKGLWAWQIALDSINPLWVPLVLQAGPGVTPNHCWHASSQELGKIARMDHFLDSLWSPVLLAAFAICLGPVLGNLYRLWLITGHKSWATVSHEAVVSLKRETDARVRFLANISSARPSVMIVKRGFRTQCFWVECMRVYWDRVLFFPAACICLTDYSGSVSHR